MTKDRAWNRIDRLFVTIESKLRNNEILPDIELLHKYVARYATSHQLPKKHVSDLESLYEFDSDKVDRFLRKNPDLIDILIKSEKLIHKVCKDSALTLYYLTDVNFTDGTNLGSAALDLKICCDNLNGANDLNEISDILYKKWFSKLKGVHHRLYWSVYTTE